MRNYFKFNLTGKKLFPLWLFFIILFIIPHVLVKIKLNDFKTHATTPQEMLNQMGVAVELYGAMIFLNIVEYGILFFWARKSIEALEIKEHALAFTGKLGQFMKIFIPGIILSNITFGIYYPWFLAQIYRFFAGKSAYESEHFEFRGKGTDLFVITLCCLVLPLIAIILPLMVAAFIAGVRVGPDNETVKLIIELFSAITFVVIIAMTIPYIYFFYKWLVHVRYKSYTIQWKTDFWPSAGKIATEVAFTVLTLGIYTPLALMRLYSYFSERTFATSETNRFQFGYDLEAGKDFGFLWGQILLTIITLGIYFPWAYCRISERVLRKTYMQPATALPE